MSGIPEPGDLWQHIAVGYCEWENGEWPDDDDIREAQAAAKHIAGYVSRYDTSERDRRMRAMFRAETAEVERDRLRARVAELTDAAREVLRMEDEILSGNCRDTSPWDEALERLRSLLEES